MIYLRYSVNTLFNRLLKNSNKRPLIKNLNNNELRTYIETTLKKREKTYRRSHKIIECDYLSEKEILREINSFIITF